MNPLTAYVQEAMTELVSVRERIDGLRVSTHCLYPTNEFVHVVVRGSDTSFHVSDEGGAYKQLSASGYEGRIHEGNIKHIVTSQGLILEGSVIRSPIVPKAALPMAIALVANASKESADWFYTHLQIKRTRDFKKIVRNFLRERFDRSVKHDEMIVGKSNKQHKFENVVVSDGKRFIVDPVLHEHASISSRIVANLDVKAALHENLVQRIVYDDEGEEWSSADLNLLAVGGAPVVPFGRSRSVIAEMIRP